MRFDKIGKSEFLDNYPGMSLGPAHKDKLIFRGGFDFKRRSIDEVEIEATYKLEIHFPFTFPRELPKVWEIEEKIPRDGKHHTNSDGSLCLGSPIRLIEKINSCPTFSGFAENCLIPFLYIITRQIRRGDGFISGELDHGEPGIIADYMKIFGLESRSQVIKLLQSLGMKKRIANKYPCPCDCGKRLGCCSFHKTVNKYRKTASRSWFRLHASNPGSGM
ncbi:MAG: hypothetical protein VX642_03700 [Bdellovibrionota bacterium]|nr:hypothetical protein [Bdellovibrionota bacterium]